MEYSELINRIQVLTETIEVSEPYKNMTPIPYTTIDTLEEYIEELEKQVKSIDH